MQYDESASGGLSGAHRWAGCIADSAGQLILESPIRLEEQFSSFFVVLRIRLRRGQSNPQYRSDSSSFFRFLAAFS